MHQPRLWVVRTLVASAVPLGGLVASVALAACGDDDAAADAAPPAPDASASGALSLSWVITDGNETLSCADVDASAVGLVLVPVGGLGSLADGFACSSGQATTVQVPARTYDIALSVRASEGELGEPTRLRGVVVEPGRTTELPPLELIVEPVGSFQFQLVTGVAGGNCAGGAELQSVVLELHRGNVCVPTNFVVGDTAYASDCAGARFDGCVEATTAITVSDVRSGPQTLVATGLTAGAVACYQRSAALSVPGGRLSTVLGPVSLPRDPAVPDCGPGPLDAGP